MKNSVGWLVLGLLLLLQFLSISSIPSKVSNLVISWNITSVSRKDGRMILNNVFGNAAGGRLHAIMGPSGSGKTTLLNLLAREPPVRGFTRQGQLYATQRFDPIFIQQEDLLFPQLTSRETLDISFQLRRDQPDKVSRVQRVNQLLLLLGLKASSETKVGDAKTRGLSGGEKKRLAIGNEIVDQDDIGSEKSSFVFADEPTTGLDCFQAEKVMNILSSLAKNGSLVITTIHQPRASIVKLFDDITILSEGGSLIYSGPMEDLVSYFSTVGYPCPENINPAEYYIDLVSIDYSSKESERLSVERITRLATLFHQRYRQRGVELNQKLLQDLQQPRKLKTERGKQIVIPGKRSHPLKSFLQRVSRQVKTSVSKFVVLFSRAFKQVIRDRSLNTARLMSSLFSALLFGSIYYKLGSSEKTIPDRLGLLQVAAVNTAMTSLIKATTAFVTERQIIQRERKRSNAYSIFSYFIAKLLAEIPFSSFFPVLFGSITYWLCGLNPLPGKLWRFITILVMQAIASTSLGMAVGAVVPSVEAGIAVSPAVMVLFIVFGGLYVVNAPPYLQWVKEVSLIRWAFEGLAVNEFSDLLLTKDNPNQQLVVAPVVMRGEETLNRMGFTHSIKETLIAQLGIAVFNFLVTLGALYLQDPQRQKKAMEVEI